MLKTLTCLKFEISFIFGLPLCRGKTEAIFVESEKTFFSILLSIAAVVRSGVKKSVPVFISFGRIMSTPATLFVSRHSISF